MELIIKCNTPKRRCSDDFSDTDILLRNNTRYYRLKRYLTNFIQIINTPLLYKLNNIEYYGPFIKYNLIIFLNYILFNIFYMPNTIFQIMLDSKDIFLNNTLIYFLAYYENNKFDTILNILTLFLTILIYNSVSNIPNFGSIVYSDYDINNMREESYNTLILALLLLIIILSYNIRIAYKRKILLSYLFSFFILILYIILFTLLTISNNYKVHIHHWFVGEILAILSRFNTKISMFMHFFSLGIYLHGITFYDASFIYDIN